MIRTAIAALLSLFAVSSAYAQSSSLDPPAQTVATTTAASSLSVPGQALLLGLHLTAPSAGYVMVFDATSPPPDGAVTPAACFTVPPPVSPGTSATLAMSNSQESPRMVNGISVVFSTGASCYSKVASATAFIAVLYQ